METILLVLLSAALGASGHFIFDPWRTTRRTAHRRTDPPRRDCTEDVQVLLPYEASQDKPTHHDHHPSPLLQRFSHLLDRASRLVGVGLCISRFRAGDCEPLPAAVHVGRRH